MDVYDWWRAANLLVAALAIVINVGKSIELRLFSTVFERDSAVGFLALLAWCAGYLVATSVAWGSGVPAGPWTCVMTVPLLWSLIAGVMRPPRRRTQGYNDL